MSRLRRWRAHVICALTKPWLAALVDGEIKGRWWASVVVKHLEECPPCAELVEQMRATKPVVADAAGPAPQPPASLWPAIEQRLAEAPVHYPARFAPLWAPVGVFLVAVIGVTIVLLARHPTPALAAEQFRRHYMQSLPSRKFGELEVSDTAAAQSWLQQRVTFTCHLMPQMAGYALAQVGTMSDETGRTVAVAAFRHDDELVVLYAMPSAGATPPPWDRDRTENGDIYVTSVTGTYLACWVHGATMYLAIGRRPLVRFARDCLADMNGRRPY